MKLHTGAASKYTYVLDEDPILFMSVLSLGPVENPSSNDFFNTSLKNIFLNDCESRVFENTLIQLCEGIQGACSHYENFDQKHCVFKIPSISPEKRMYFFANLRLVENKTVFLKGTGNSSLKLWIDDQLVYHGYNDPFEMSVLLPLEEGDHMIIMECCGSAIPYLSFRISDYNEDLLKDGRELAVEYVENKVKGRYHVKTEECTTDQESLEFMILPKDFTNKKWSKIMVEVKTVCQDTIDSFEANLCQKVQWRIPEANVKGHCLLNIEAWDSNHSRKQLPHIVPIRPIIPYLRQLQKSFKVMENEGRILKKYRVNIEGSFQEIMGLALLGKLKQDKLSYLAHKLFVLHQTLVLLQKGRNYREVIQSVSFIDCYFESELDGSIEKYAIHLPKCYIETKPYPLVIVLPIGRYAHISTYVDPDQFNGLANEEVIVACISCRGVTLGSYIGEAAFFESLNLLFNDYSIDRNRVYLTGFSNGGYATWALAQAYPHFFAAIAPISGEPYAPNLGNLSNLHVINICGDSDYLLENGFQVPGRMLENYSYQGVSPYGTNHSNGYFYYCNSFIIRQLLLKRRDPVPKFINYRSEREQHNEAYWIREMSMSEEESYCQIKAEVQGNSNIVIKQSYLKAFVLDLTAIIDEGEFTVTVNGVSVPVKRGISHKLRLEERGGVWRAAEETARVSSSKGMGLLYVYLKPLIIVVPKHYSNEDEKKVFENLAQKLSSPKTNGWDPTVYVKYPIITEQHFQNSDLASNNYAIIGTPMHECLYKVSEPLGLRFEMDYFHYKGNRYDGDYCVWTIQNNPKNQLRMLLICTNRLDLLKKNILARSIIIPGYSNGLHPLWNQSLVWFDGVQYRTL